MHLSERIDEKNHRLYMDNHFSNTAFFNILKQNLFMLWHRKVQSSFQ